MQQLRNFMQGRYGYDIFSLALFIFSIVLSIILRLFTRGYVSLISYVPLGFAIYRILSKDIETRQKENEWFTRNWRKVYGSFKKSNQNLKDHQEYKYFKCPNCGQKLRAPRGAGKIKVTCQRCGKIFIKKI